MTEALRHRGPDDGDVWIDAAAGVALGHRRLAIVDLSPAGHQPMHSDGGRYVLTFNGEIYNHLELRTQLGSAKAAAWRGRSDTETLLACFAAWGVRTTLERATGMFALGLWDRVERRLWLARDRFGEKPLYYGWSNGAFAFASELGALRRVPQFDCVVDRDVLALYLQFNYVPAPYSIYRSIFKLEAGCLMALGLEEAAMAIATAPRAPFRTGGLQIEAYWSLAAVARDGLANPIADENEAIDELEKTLRAAVHGQCVADVPLGAFLSGGIDSSTIVALMQAQSSRPIKTFTIGFNEAGFDEAKFAKEVARHLRTDHTELYVTPRETQDVIPKLTAIYSEPFADASQIPTHLVSKLARTHVTVALSGDAGDELFGGYNRYLWGRRIWRRVGWMPLALRRAVGRTIQTMPAIAWDRVGTLSPLLPRVNRLGDKAHKLAARMRTVRDLDGLYRSLVTEWRRDVPVVPGAQPLATLLDVPKLVEGIEESEHRMMLWDSLTYLPDDILHKVDRAAMAVGLESRVPFLDRDVVRLAWRLPLRMKVRDERGKWILRQVLNHHVPENLFERPKSGFGIPVGKWLRGPLRDWAEDLLSEHRLAAGDYFDTRLVRGIWSEHLSGRRDWAARIWSLLMFQAWLRKEG
jgi:asparagine synthase (glutamine-hydrolysing)